MIEELTNKQLLNIFIKWLDKKDLLNLFMYEFIISHKESFESFGLNVLHKFNHINNTHKICYLISHDIERKRMGENAILKAEQYRLDGIMQKWIRLFESL